MVFDDGEMSGPIGSAFERGNCGARHIRRRRRRNTKKDNAARCGQARTERQFAKVFVECDDDTILTLGTRKYLNVTAAGRVSAHPNHVMSALPQCHHRIAGKFSFARMRMR
jgi:hypothetical protein